MLGEENEQVGEVMASNNPKIHLSLVHIENFRSIKEVEVSLSPFSILFGMNDSGKSNLLYALKHAFKAGNINESDVYSSPECPYSREKAIIIDLMFIPINNAGDRIKSFDDAWGRHFGENIFTDNNDFEFFAFRTKYTYDSEKDEYVWERNLINLWENNKITVGKGIGFKTTSVIDFIFLDAQRDIALDIRDKSSLWNKQIANIQLSEEIKTEVEDSLALIGTKIKNEAPILKKVEDDLSNALDVINNKVEISPVTRSISELYKGLDIYITPTAADSFPIANLGLGTRSRAVFSSLKTIINKYLDKSQSNPYFCILALEEPEAHIHPNSQRRLIQYFCEITGQKIITTHSPYIISTSNINDLIYASLQDAKSKYISLLTMNIDKEEIRKVERAVLNSRGDILFSAITVLVEGETEEQALPVFFQEYFNKPPNFYGVNFVGVGGSGKNYLPFLQVLEIIGVKWFVFIDGESNTIDQLNKTLNAIQKEPNETSVSDYDNIVIIDDSNYESYLIENNYSNVIIKAINEYEDNGRKEHTLSFFDNYKKNYTKNHKIDNLDENTILLACMKKEKTRYARIIAQTICRECHGDRKFPPKIKELLVKIDGILKVIK